MTLLLSGDRKTPWAATLPVAQNLGTLKYEAKINRRVLPEDTPPDRPIRYIDIGTVDSKGRVGALEAFRFEDAPSRARRIPVHGDTIVSTVRTYLRAIAYVDSPHADTVCSTGFAVISPGSHLDSRFLGWWLRSQYFVDEVCARSVGVSYPATNAWELGSLPVPILPLSLQQQIAAFLDSETAVVDELIKKKERLVELLQEKRQALITQAVTKGLTPSGTMKESGVGWIGRVPRHWDCVPLGARYSVQLGKMLDAGRGQLGREVLYLRNANIYWDGIDISDVHSMVLNSRDQARYRLRDGDLLVSEGGGNGNAVGKAAIWQGELAECYYQKALHRLRPWDEQRDIPNYLLLALRSAWASGAFIAGSNPNTVFHLTAEKLRQHRFPFPSVSEQREIVSRVGDAVTRIDNCVQGTLKSVGLLAEYRQALISATVTGQLAPSKEAA